MVTAISTDMGLICGTRLSALLGRGNPSGALGWDCTCAKGEYAKLRTSDKGGSGRLSSFLLDLGRHHEADVAEVRVCRVDKIAKAHVVAFGEISPGMPYATTAFSTFNIPSHHYDIYKEAL